MSSLSSLLCFLLLQNLWPQFYWGDKLDELHQSHAPPLAQRVVRARGMGLGLGGEEKQETGGGSPALRGNNQKGFWQLSTLQTI